jgi:hypothetical protein
MKRSLTIFVTIPVAHIILGLGQQANSTNDSVLFISLHDNKNILGDLNIRFLTVKEIGGRLIDFRSDACYTAFSWVFILCSLAASTEAIPILRKIFSII